MLHIVERVEKFIIRALIILLLLAMVLGTIELGRITILEIFAPPLLLLDISKIFEGFGLALVILIGLELLKVLKLFLLEDKIKPEIIVEIAVIAVCYKIITLDTKHIHRAMCCSASQPFSSGFQSAISFFAFGNRTGKRFKKRPPETNQTVKVVTKLQGRLSIYV